MDVNKTRELLTLQEIKVISNVFLPEQEDGYLAFLLRSIMPGIRLTFPRYVKTLDKQLNKIRYLPYFGENEIFQIKWLAQPKQKGFDRLYFPKEYLVTVIAYLNNYLLCLDQESTETNVKLPIRYDHLSLTLHHLLASPNFGTNIHVAVQQVDHLLQGLEQETIPLASRWDVFPRLGEPPSGGSGLYPDF